MWTLPGNTRTPTQVSVVTQAVHIAIARHMVHTPPLVGSGRNAFPRRMFHHGAVRLAYVVGLAGKRRWRMIKRVTVRVDVTHLHLARGSCSCNHLERCCDAPERRSGGGRALTPFGVATGVREDEAPPARAYACSHRSPCTPRTRRYLPKTPRKRRSLIESCVCGAGVQISRYDRDAGDDGLG